MGSVRLASLAVTAQIGRRLSFRSDAMQAKMPVFKTFTTEWAWEVHGQREADCTRTHEEREGRDDPDRNGSKTVM